MLLGCLSRLTGSGSILRERSRFSRFGLTFYGFLLILKGVEAKLQFF